METKILALIAGAGFLAITGCEQSIPESEVPSVVLNAFNLEFEDPLEVDWEKKSDFYSVEFEIQNKDHEALIDENGKLIKFKKELEVTELSEELKSTLATGFSEMKIDDVHLLVMNDSQYYQVEFDGNLSKARKVFNETGEEMKDVIYFD